MLCILLIKHTGPPLKARAHIAVLPGIQPLLKDPRLRPWTSQTVCLAPYLIIKAMPLSGTRDSPKILCHYLEALV